MPAIRETDEEEDGILFQGWHHTGSILHHEVGFKT